VNQGLIPGRNGLYSQIQTYLFFVFLFTKFILDFDSLIPLYSSFFLRGLSSVLICLQILTLTLLRIIMTVFMCYITIVVGFEVFTVVTMKNAIIGMWHRVDLV
jgi:hypothetical protein